MISALLRAFGQLGDPRIQRTLWTSIGVTLGLLALVIAATIYGLARIGPTDIPLLDTAFGVLGGAGVLIVAFLVFPSLIGITASFFLDSVADAVERRHYPGLPPPRTQGIVQAVGTALRFFAVIILFNLLALAVVWFIPLINLIVFVGVNGYLLGREYFELVAMRRLDATAVKHERRRHAGRIFLAGVILALLLLVPFLNLAVPILGTAFMVHIFQRVAVKLSGQ